MDFYRNDIINNRSKTITKFKKDTDIDNQISIIKELLLKVLSKDFTYEIIRDCRYDKEIKNEDSPAFTLYTCNIVVQNRKNIHSFHFKDDYLDRLFNLNDIEIMLQKYHDKVKIQLAFEDYTYTENMVDRNCIQYYITVDNDNLNKFTDIIYLSTMMVERIHKDMNKD